MTTTDPAQFQPQRLRLERTADGVVTLTLADPDKRNAIGPELHAELMQVAGLMATDEQARALVVTGEGTAFCAGADLGALFDHEGADLDEQRRRQMEYYASFLWLRDLPYPTIAAVNGHAIGAGLNLALACDIVVAGPAAKFGATFSRIGLHPGGGCTYFLVQRMGASRALRTLLLGQVLGGQEAVAAGLADQLAADPAAAAAELAAHVASLHPHLVSNMKKAVAVAASGDYLGTVELESWAQAASSQHPETLAGIRAAGRSTQSR